MIDHKATLTTTQTVNDHSTDPHHVIMTRLTLTLGMHFKNQLGWIDIK